MRTSNFLEKYFDSIDFGSIYAVIYEYIYIVCDVSFNYCPAHYQMVYFYFPILYLILRSRRKNELYNESHNSTLNYIFLTMSNFFKKLLNSNFIIYIFTNFFKKFYFFIKILFDKTIGFKITHYRSVFKKNHTWLSWKPVFKKFSYFGIFSFIRSKWYKNK